MTVKKFFIDKKINIITIVFALFVMLVVYVFSNAFFHEMQENINTRIEINTLYQHWILTKQSVISYLTSEKKKELRKNININIRIFEKNFSSIENCNNRHFSDEIHGLEKDWFEIKNSIIQIFTSDNDFDHFEKQLYWISNSTNGFDWNLRVIIAGADKYYQVKLKHLWNFFYVGIIILILIIVNFIFYLRKISKSLRTDKEYKKLVQDLMESREREKQNMALEIHDTVIQNMTFSRMLCMDLVNSSVSPEKNEKLTLLTNGIVNALQQIRDISYDIRPPEMAKGIRQIITLYFENWKIKSGKKGLFICSGMDQLKITDTFKLNVYRIIQELLTNIGKHSDATEVKVVMLASYPSIIIKVSDNSSGYNLAVALSKSDGKAHSGLRGINERVRISKGEIKIKTDMGKGVLVSIIFPIEGNVNL